MSEPTPTAAPALACSNLHRFLGRGEGRVHALQGVSLEVMPGKSYAIVGPSGCGKTTLLYALGLLDRPDEGGVYVRGADLSGADDETRTRVRAESIGFVFQFHFLLAEFTAMENVALPMLRRGALPKPACLARAKELLERVGLADKAARMANNLSGGEQQRLAVARALSNAPRVVLADEPTGNLDAANARRVIELLIGLARDRGAGVVVVTHNPEIAEQCDVELRMKDGRFEA